MKIFKHVERGFTLMELMVVIVIVAILAAVAVPLYINYVNDARLTEAKGAIGAIVTAEQTYFQEHGEYLASTFTNGHPDATDLRCDLSDAALNWTFVVDNVTGTNNAPNSSFHVTADGRSGTPVDTHHAWLTFTRNAQPQWDLK
jgi:prepilin-type N-terminal cleavage/methylation domain-containing protein